MNEKIGKKNGNHKEIFPQDHDGFLLLKGERQFLYQKKKLDIVSFHCQILINWQSDSLTHWIRKTQSIW